jgi:hypothetical protein
MHSCPNYKTCNANLCPLDSDLEKRTWFIGEDVCSRKDNAGLPMIRRQRQLNKRRPSEYSGKPLSSGWLSESAPRKRQISDEHRAALSERMRLMNEAKNSEC